MRKKKIVVFFYNLREGYPKTSGASENAKVFSIPFNSLIREKEQEGWQLVKVQQSLNNAGEALITLIFESEVEFQKI